MQPDLSPCGAAQLKKSLPHSSRVVAVAQLERIR
jgi:hypothetical protein